MAMDAVLDQLEERIDRLVVTYSSAQQRITELEARINELEEQTVAGAEVVARNRALEQQRDVIGTRLEKVLEVIDSALEGQPEGS